jgi:hypothetical protein
MTMLNNGECDLACMTQACGYDGGGFDCAQTVPARGEIESFLTSRLPPGPMPGRQGQEGGIFYYQINKEAFVRKHLPSSAVLPVCWPVAAALSCPVCMLTS